MAASSAIVFYISGHGFGHASRCIEVINAILARRPETRVGVRTAAPRWLFDLTVKAKGDVAVDYHHTVEDVGLVLGQAFREALGDKLGIRRYGFFLLPMDESLARVVVDVGEIGRAHV